MHGETLAVLLGAVLAVSTNTAYGHFTLPSKTPPRNKPLTDETNETFQSSLDRRKCSETGLGPVVAQQAAELFSMKTALQRVETALQAAEAKLQTSDGRLQTVEDELLSLKKELSTRPEQPQICENYSKYNQSINPIPVGNGYYMVFRVQSGIGKSAWSKFTAVGRNDDGDALVKSMVPCGCRTTDGRLPCGRHYRSKLLDLWDLLPIDRVRVGVYKDNVEQRFWEFNAEGSDFQNWFSQRRLLGDSYTDLSSTDPTTNFFSVRGDDNHQRRLFINKSYRGCPNDYGWLDVTEKVPPTCGWEKTGSYPSIFYSKTGHVTNWNAAEDVGVADVLIVSVKFKENGTCQTA